MSIVSILLAISLSRDIPHMLVSTEYKFSEIKRVHYLSINIENIETEMKPGSGYKYQTIDRLLYVNTKGNEISIHESSYKMRSEENLILRYQWTREVMEKKRNRKDSEDGCKSKETLVGFKFHKRERDAFDGRGRSWCVLPNVVAGRRAFISHLSLPLATIFNPFQPCSRQPHARAPTNIKQLRKRCASSKSIDIPLATQFTVIAKRRKYQSNVSSVNSAQRKIVYSEYSACNLITSTEIIILIHCAANDRSPHPCFFISYLYTICLLSQENINVIYQNNNFYLIVRTTEVLLIFAVTFIFIFIWNGCNVWLEMRK